MPLFYASALVLDGLATGVLVEAHDGHPTKVEGNPDHPASLGGTGVFEQAAILGLYDADRGRTIRRGDAPATFESFARAFRPAAAGGAGRAKPDGAGLHVLLEPQGSPLIADLVAKVRAAYPAARLHFHAPLSSGAGWEATRALFGRPLAPRLDLAKATTVLALDADFLAAGPESPRHARQLAARRDPASAEMVRLYVVEPAITPTGAAADHRIARRASDVAAFAAAVLAEVVRQRGSAVAAPARVLAALERLRAGAPDERIAKALAGDLARSAGAGIVLAGDRQPAATHAIAALLNEVLGNVGRTVSYAAPTILEAGEPSHGLASLVQAIDAGAVSSLVILEGNPVYSAPADLDLAARIRRVPQTVYLGQYEDETARACGWYVPAAHGLESWGDARAADGTASIIQPLITPLFGGRTASEVLSALLPESAPAARDLVRQLWQRRSGLADPEFELFWRRALERGVVPGTALPEEKVALDLEAALPLLERAGAPGPDRGLEAVFARDAAVHDGRFTNNAWLLELPDPITKLTYDKAALVGPATAARLGIESGDVLALTLRGRTIEAPAFVAPGHAEDSITLPLGYGRAGAESRARGVGFNAYALRTSDAPSFDLGLSVAHALRAGEPPPLGLGPPAAPARRRHALATTQMHGSLEGRPIVREASLEAYRRDPGLAQEKAPRALPLYEPWPQHGVQWGMAIDLNRCTGCSACVVACQSENNIPVVGKAEVERSREMHWLRIDRYFAGPPEAPAVVFQPMLCQHCEKAPCEYVCPVNATTHSPDGLNEQTYNRCVGTRFCSNNCAWKVRRFNWFDNWKDEGETAKMAMNPDVTVRERGVMEKCTFCVQRIREAEIHARIEGRAIREGEFQTACQQVCPAEAIVFGAVSDPGSRVSALWRDPRSYAVLEELGTRPRIRYLARVRNPNPELG